MRVASRSAMGSGMRPCHTQLRNCHGRRESDCMAACQLMLPRTALESDRPHSTDRMRAARVLTEFLVDLILHRQAVAVPAKAAGDVVARAAGIPGHNVLGTGGGAGKSGGWVQGAECQHRLGG